MRAYLSYFRMQFIGGLQYRSAALASVGTNFFWGFMEILLYKTIYETSSGNFPMELSAVVSYIWMRQAFLMLFAQWWWIDREIYESIETGSVAYELCRPTNLYGMWFFRGMATRISRTALRCLPILAVAMLLPAPYGLRFPADPATFFWFLLSMLLAFLLTVAISTLTYFLCFFTVNSMGIRLLMLAAGELFSGDLIPIPFFPDALRKLAELLPFASAQNVTFRIYSGDISGQDIYIRIGLQVFWILAILLLGQILSRLAVRRTVVQGG